MNFWKRGLSGLTLLGLPAVASASGMLSTVQTGLHSAIFPWESVMQSAARNLFFALAAVEFSILFLNHVLQKRGHEDLFSGIIKKVVTLGFFLTVIDNAGTWFPDIINGLAGGTTALGITAVTPGAIADDALTVFLALVMAPFHAVGQNASSVMPDILGGNFSAAASAATKTVVGSLPGTILIEELMMVIIGLLAGIGVLMMALEFLMVQLESYLVLALGIVMLAGGGLRWTSKYVGTFFDYAINVGVRLFMLTAIAFLVSDVIVKQMTTILTNITNPLQAGFEALILGGIIALLPKKASSIANSLLSGKSSFTGGELGKSMATVGVGTVAAGTAAFGGVALAAGAAGGGGAGGLSAAASAGSDSGGAASGGLSAAAGSGSSGAAAGVPVPAGVLSKTAGGANAAPKPATDTQAPAKPAAGPSATPADGQKTGDAVVVPKDAPARGSAAGSVPADTGANSSPVSESAEGGESAAPTDRGGAPVEAPAPSAPPAPVSDAHGVPVPPSAWQRVQKSADVLKDLHKNTHSAIDHVSEDNNGVGTGAIQTGHPSDW